MGNAYLSSKDTMNLNKLFFIKLLKIDKDYYKAYNNLGQVLNLLGKYEEAEKKTFKRCRCMS